MNSNSNDSTPAANPAGGPPPKRNQQPQQVPQFRTVYYTLDSGEVVAFRVRI